MSVPAPLVVGRLEEWHSLPCSDCSQIGGASHRLGIGWFCALCSPWLWSDAPLDCPWCSAAVITRPAAALVAGRFVNVCSAAGCLWLEVVPVVRQPECASCGCVLTADDKPSIVGNNHCLDCLDR